MSHLLSSLRAGALVALLAGSALMAPPAWAADLTLERIEIQQGATTTVDLTLSEDAGGAASRPFAMSEPDRLVIDIADAKVGSSAAEVEVAGLVSAVDIESFDDGQGTITRVKLTLTGPVDHTVQANGSRIKVQLAARAASADPMAAALSGGGSGEATATTSAESAVATDTLADDRPLSGPCLSGSGCADGDVPNGPSVRSIDFQNLDKASRVVIGTRAGAPYTTSQPRPDLIVVDFPGAFLPQSLGGSGRVLDTSQFLSPVRMVRAYRTSSGARVAISLRRETTFNVQEGQGGLVFVDVAIPAGMQEEIASSIQQSSSAAPSESSDGLNNAYQSELLIGSSGRTSDPQAAFGSGSGANDPASLLGMSGGFNFDGGSAATMGFSGRKISLDLVNADVHSVFRLISNVSNLNIVAGDDVTGDITVRLQDVPWDQALAAVLQAKGLGSQRFGNILRVAPIETIKAEQQSALEAKRAQEELEDLEMLVLPLNYATASDLVNQIGAVLSKRGSVEVDDRANQLIIKDAQDTLAQIRELVRHLDKETPQVLIEARIVEANTAYTRALGIQWGGELDASTRTGYSTGLFFPNEIGTQGGLSFDGESQFYSATQDSLLVDLGADGSSSAINFHLGSIPGLVDLDARLSAMESDGYGKVVSSPRVTTIDNSEASITQGQRIPFLSSSAGGTNVQFINASLELTVTPHITSDNQVFLNVSVTNNRADFSQLVQGNPAIQIKEIKTELLIEDGETSVIGGVFATEESASQDRVPGLHAIPLLGALFRSSSRAMSRNELLVFITPQVVKVKSGS